MDTSHVTKLQDLAVWRHYSHYGVGLRKWNKHKWIVTTK